MDSTGRNWFIKNQPQILRTFEKKTQEKVGKEEKYVHKRAWNKEEKAKSSERMVTYLLCKGLGPV